MKVLSDEWLENFKRKQKLKEEGKKVQFTRYEWAWVEYLKTKDYSYLVHYLHIRDEQCKEAARRWNRLHPGYHREAVQKYMSKPEKKRRHYHQHYISVHWADFKNICYGCLDTSQLDDEEIEAAYLALKNYMKYKVLPTKKLLLYSKKEKGVVQ